MWALNKTTDRIINILVFLLAINIFHYGQFILPIICLLITIDRKKLNIENVKVFILLCLFAITFFAFSYKLGFYSVMGFCLPMAYYIGTNILVPSQENVKKLIYIVAFGMASHVVLNFVMDFSAFGFEYVTSRIHYDVWTHTNIKETITAINYTFIIGCVYYLFTYEKNKYVKISGILLLILLFLYNIGLGRRTPILMLAISLLISIIFDILKYKNKYIYKKILFLALIILVCAIFIAILVFFNIFGLKDLVNSFIIVKKFIWSGLKTERVQLFLDAVKLMPYHLFGGQEISNTVGIYIHDLWMDTYDFAGIIPYLLLIIYSILYLINMIKIYKSNGIISSYKILFITLFVVISIQMFLDPIMTGSSIFLIVSVIVGGSFERLINYYE